MEPPPAPPLGAAPPRHITHPDSLNSSPRSQNSFDSSLYPSIPSSPISKLRLMCSYGGHIVPRLHDKSLSYIGGETRIVVIDRHTTLSNLTHRLSKILQYNTQSFILKYQLPNEDLDSLISINTGEDLENMIDEYDRLSSATKNINSSRLRIFIFPSKPDSGSSIGSLTENSTKSEDRFLNALDVGGTSGFSDSSSVNCLLGLDDDVVIAPNLNSSVKDAAHDIIHLIPDSVMAEMTSFTGSASSSLSVGNFPAIGVSGEDQKVEIEKRFAPMSVVGNVQQKKDGGIFVAVPEVSGVPVSYAPVMGDYRNRVSTGNERSEQGMVMGNRKPLLAQLEQHTQSRGLDLPSPDSVSSDGSITNPLSRQKTIIYQEPIVQIQSAHSRSPASSVESNITDPKTSIQMPQLQDYGYVLPTQFDPQLNHQQQFITQYIPSHSSGTVPTASYYPVYPQKQQRHTHHSATEHHQYPVYYMTAKQTQPYSEAAPAPNPGMASALYRTATTGAAPLVQVPSSQQQQQPRYAGLSQMHHQSHSMAFNLNAHANYEYEFAEPTQADLYYTRASAPQFAAHHPVENIKQQVRTSQP
ncbi:hypothetical protein LguiB_025153 [Lonicera macranthoides]